METVYIVNVSGHILGQGHDRGHHGGGGGGRTRGAAAGATAAAVPDPAVTGTAGASPRVPARAPGGQGHDLDPGRDLGRRANQRTGNEMKSRQECKLCVTCFPLDILVTDTMNR